jgi:hypothetical protein
MHSNQANIVERPGMSPGSRWPLPKNPQRIFPSPDLTPAAQFQESPDQSGFQRTLPINDLKSLDPRLRGDDGN